MPKILLPVVAAALLPVAALSVTPPTTTPPPFAAEGLLAGCGDIPEVVALVEELRIREDRIKKALAELDDKKSEIASARATLTAELRRFKQAGKPLLGSKTSTQRAVDADIARLVAVYEAMKPKESAAVLASLPSDFAAEILMRVNPETGARIIAAIEPQKAAILTTYMGARSTPLR
ncbi:hypothetical protein FQV27_12775 [Paracoccus aurantiacus]|uniref:Magnesium transporter MgtE intracellular domain-containing protein n=1 Tax=Paracoccus aurantiacus TaxID=2599412 RepID=A0A5C6RZN5_9RHOB|nr:hypothetical protein [Paracoccus aurantiacus]TXB68056.1 hypothetical protein FQV27_12775 [Paracoccus aurantiacus]